MFKNFNSKNFVFLVLMVIFLISLPKISGILLLFFTAYVIAAALNPYVEKLVSKNISRTLSTVIVVLGAMISIFILFVPIFVMAYKEIRVFIGMLPEKFAMLSEFLLNFRLQGLRITEIIDLNSVIGNSTNIAQNIFSQSLNFTVGFAQVCVIGIAVTMIVFYLLMDSKYIEDKFFEFFPPKLKEKSNHILTTITFKVGRYVRAQIISMVAVGIMVMLSLLVLGIEYPLLLGLISGILDIIPILGPTLALAVIVLVAYQYGIVKVIIAIVLFLLSQQLSNYVIRPFLFGKFMKLHPLMIFLSLFVAQQFLGLWGVIVSPAIAATVCVLVDELYLKPLNSGAKVE